MSGEPREEMVCNLEVQPAVDELDGRGADHIGGCSELAVDEGFGWAQVGGGLGEMRQYDLDQHNQNQGQQI